MSGSLPCGGHFPTCTHRDGFMACRDCIRERGKTGLIFCDDLDNCGGPGCMDHLATAPNLTSTAPSDAQSSLTVTASKGDSPAPDGAA